MIYWQLFLAFFRIGIFGYGGGPTMLPLFHVECVKRYGWISAEEFADTVGFANALPGPIATKMASYIGYKVKGWTGALIANCAVTLPVLLGMMGLLSLVYTLKNSGAVKGMVTAIQPVIAVMMAAMAFEVIQKGWKDAGDRKTGLFGMILVSVIGIVLLDIHPGILVAVTLLGAFVLSTRTVRQQKKQMEKATSKGA
jgi:chromate transporter